MSFELGRGVNISHWLSQSERRGQERRAWFVQTDVERLAACGFDHLRFPVDEEQLWNERGERESEAFELLEQGLGWCEQAGLRTVVDLHIVRSHHFNVDTNRLFAEPAEQDKFCALWADLSQALARWSVDRVYYELLNEPKTPDDGDWNKLAARALAEVRVHEPERMVAIDSNGTADPRMFSGLRVPEDENLILSFHFYDPLLFTHYRAYWSEVNAYEGPIDYPGELAPKEDWDELPESVRFGARNERVFGAPDIERVLAPALALAGETGMPLWCGELGALGTTPDVARARWYRDVLGALDRHGIPWTLWDYKGDFGIFDRAGQPTYVHRILSGIGLLS
ncbi:MAG: cellulase family glycosylhydrolase [Gaiellaceae bacterium]